MTDNIDTSPEALLALASAITTGTCELNVGLARVFRVLAAEKVDLVRGWDEERKEAATWMSGALRLDAARRTAEADAAAMREALKEALEFVDRHSEDWYINGQECLQQIRDALSSTAGTDLLERMERMRALLERLKTARPLLLYGDAWIAEIEAALADQPGEKS